MSLPKKTFSPAGLNFVTSFGIHKHFYQLVQTLTIGWMINSTLFCTFPVSGKMLDFYYKIVAETMQDCTAKAVVTFLVNEVREALNAELCVALMQGELLDELFNEKEDITFTRQTHLEKLKVITTFKNSSRFQGIFGHIRLIVDGVIRLNVNRLDPC